jgi:hypothetical protein
MAIINESVWLNAKPEEVWPFICRAVQGFQAQLKQLVESNVVQ